MIINSLTNKKIKDLVKLKDVKNVKKLNKYLIDGEHLVKEALKKNIVLEIFVEENKNFDFLLANKKIKITYISRNVVKHLADTKTPQGIFAICKIEKTNYNFSDFENIVILDRVQDPGNLGTIIRTACAFGYSCVVLGDGCCNLYNQKVLRSMQGSNFHIPIIEENIFTLIEKIKKDFTIYATSLKTDYYMEDIKFKKEKFAVIFGNEANGVDNKILDLVDKHLKIKMLGSAESLNVSTSSAIVMHYLKNI